MSPIFKCLICKKDIERSKKSFWSKKGHLLCSSCLDNMDLEKKKTLESNPKSFLDEINLPLTFLEYSFNEEFLIKQGRLDSLNNLTFTSRWP